jgi:hypothetical protein
MKPTLRCSSLDRALSCHGSLTIEPLVDKRDGDEGIEGTCLHHISASRFVAEYGAVGESGPTPPQANLSFSKWISDFYVRHVAECVPSDWSMEVEAALAYEFGRFNLSGHIDCVALSPDGTEARGFDLKTGYNPVDIAEENEQILGYMVLLKLAYPSLRKITFYIVQPRNDEDEGYERVSSVTIEGSRLEAAVPTLCARINEALDDYLTLTTGLKQCKFCIGCSCPAIREEQKLMKLKLTPEMLAEIKRTPDDAVLGDFVVIGRMLSKPLDDAEALLHKRLDEIGVVVAGNGTTITRKIAKGGYEILEPVPLYKAAKELLVTDERIAACFKPSLSSMVTQVAEVMNVPKSGKGAVTGQSIVDVQIKPFTRQGERRLLQFN